MAANSWYNNVDWGSLIGSGIAAGSQYMANKDAQQAQDQRWQQQADLQREMAGQRGWEIMDPVLGGLASQILPMFGNAMQGMQNMPQWGQYGGGGSQGGGANGGMRSIADAARDYAMGIQNSDYWNLAQGTINDRLAGNSNNPFMNAAGENAQRFMDGYDPTGTQMAGANPFIDRAFNFYEGFAQDRNNPAGMQDYINRMRGETENGIGVQGGPYQRGPGVGSPMPPTGPGNYGSAGPRPGGNASNIGAGMQAYNSSSGRGGSGGGGGMSGGKVSHSNPGPSWASKGDPGGPLTGPTNAAGMIRAEYNKNLGDFIDESNPYLDAVIGDVSSDLQSQHVRNLAQTDALAEGAGRFGSSAFNLERAAQAADVLKQQGAASNQLRYQDYSNQLSRYDQNRLNAMGLGTQMDNNQLDNETSRHNAGLAASASRASAGAAAAAARYGADMQHDLGLRGLELEALLGQQQGSLAGAQGMSGLANLFGNLQQAGGQLSGNMAMGGLNTMQGLAGLFQGSQDTALGMIPGMMGLPMQMYGGAFDMANNISAMDTSRANAAAAANAQAYQNAMRGWQMQQTMPIDFLNQFVNIGRNIGGHVTTPTGMG